MTNAKRNGAAEFWRFIFASLVVLYHFEKIYDMIPLPLGEKLRANAGFIGVEFFFILAGFLLMRSDARRRALGAPARMSFSDAGTHALGYVRSKVSRIFPTLAFILLLFSLVLHSGGLGARLRELMGLEWEALMLGGTSFAWEDALSPKLFLIVTWFLTDLLIAGYLFTFIACMRRDVLKYFAPLAAILMYSWFGLKSFELYKGHEMYGFLSGGLLRAFAGFSLGVTAYFVYERLKALSWKLPARIALSVFEVYVVYRLCTLVWNREIGAENFRILVYMPLLIILSFLNKSALAHALSNPVSRFLGSIALPMYLFHHKFHEYYYIIKMQLWASQSGMRFISKLTGVEVRHLRTLFNQKTFDMFAFLFWSAVGAVAIKYIVALLTYLYRIIKKKISAGTPASAAGGNK
ncbi:MAG: acyltransferase family protein [Oscillospiraceae bacterium]|jgi:peptidoglycan/LPS O-acetylase OafA/YrhL|nr:acyltransferase family protein [Oscillospiraceae bacterium]